MGKHPGDLLTSLSSVAEKRDALLKDILDQHLSPPKGHISEEVVVAVTLALLCTSTEPDRRPTMRYVAQELSAQTHNYLSEPFDTVTLGKLNGTV